MSSIYAEAGVPFDPPTQFAGKTDTQIRTIQSNMRNLFTVVEGRTGGASAPTTTVIEVGTIRSSPVYHGAVGDGVTDDTVAVKAALASSKTIWLPPDRTFRITSRLDVPQGGGILSNGFGTLVMDSGSGHFDNNTGANIYNSNGVGILVSGVDNVLLSGFRIQFVWVDDRQVGAIAVRDSTGTVVEDVEAWGFSKVSGIIHLDSVTDCAVRHCYLHDCTTNSASTGQVTAVSVDDNLVAATPSKRFQVTDNRIYNMTVGASFLASFGYQADGITVGNQGSTDFVVANNVIKNVGEGIDCFGTNGSISGNTIDDAYIFGIKLIHGAQGNVVSCNQVNRPGLSGIAAMGSSSATQDTADNLVIGNVVRNVNAAGNWTASSTSALSIGDNGGTTYLARRNRFLQNYVSDGGSMKYVVNAAATTGLDNVFRDNHGTSYTVAYSTNSSASLIRDGGKAAVRATQASGQSVAAGSYVVVQYDTEAFDLMGEYNTGTYTYTAKAPRVLQVSAAARQPAANAGKKYQLAIHRNGTLYSNRAIIVGTTTDFQIALSDIVSVVPGDTIDVRLKHDEAASFTLTTNSDLTWLSISEVS